MEDLTKEKEALRNRLKEISEQEEKRLIDLAWPSYELLIGRCFKYKNSYSLPKKKSDYWWSYTRINKITKADLYCSGQNVYSSFSGVRFQTDKDGMFVISNIREYVHSVMNDSIEIPRNEFNEQFYKVLGKVNTLTLGA